MRRFALICGLLLSSFIGGAFSEPMTWAVQNAVQNTIDSRFIQAGTGAMWSGITSAIPQNWNFSDRLFVGNAANNIPTNRSNTNTTYVPNATVGPNWAPRDSQFISMATSGTTAVTGIAQSSDADSLGGGVSTIGVAGFGIGNSSTGLTARGGYFELQYVSGNYGYGLEVAVKNASSSNVSADPFYTPVGTTYGIQIDGWPSGYGPTALNPASAAIYINNSSAPNSFNNGIVFGQNSLANNVALAMALSHKLAWYSSAQTMAAQVQVGAGSPAGVVSCTGRCLYIRTDGGAGSTLYINETGGGTSGWAAK